MLGMYVAIISIWFGFIIWLSLTRNTRRGQRGELFVATILKRLPKDEYHVLNDLMIENNGYGTTQIDHIVLSIYGIFVIETKNYSGSIYGGERSEEWTKNVYGNKYSFRNPIRQNYGHIKALSNKLGVDEKYFIPIVVFTNRARLIGDFESPVIYAGELLKEIKFHNTIKFTKEQIIRMYDLLNSIPKYDRDTKKKHVKDIKEKVKNKQDLIKKGICPKCGGKLIGREGKYGTFYGCSNYPKCKYTLNP